MNEIGKRFRTWIGAQRIDGMAPRQIQEDKFRIETAAAIAKVNFYPLDDREIVEFRINRSSDGEPRFFLHAMLDDLERAKELFREMAGALVEESEHQTTHVLLVCTSGMTTTLFASKMNEVAQALSLDYDFVAMPIERAVNEAEGFSAILLAPQASHLRRQMVTTYPDAIVFEVPAKIFGSYDAAGAVRLLMHAFHDMHGNMVPHEGLRAARDLSNDRRIMIITLFALHKYARLGYRIYDHGTIVKQGAVRKSKVDMRDIEDLLETLEARGNKVAQLDAIGIAVPGVAYHGTISLPGIIEGSYDLRSHIQDRFGVPVNVDNNCNAAVVGCYVSQDQFESIVFFRQELGHEAGGFGTVIDGRLLKGRHNLAGEPKNFQLRFDYGELGEDARWTPDGLFQIAHYVILTAVSLIAPEAVYVAVDTVDDMDALRKSLVEDRREGEVTVGLTEDLVPPFFQVTDYVERVYLGELSLCLQKLSDPDYRSLGVA